MALWRTEGKREIDLLCTEKRLRYFIIQGRETSSRGNTQCVIQFRDARTHVKFYSKAKAGGKQFPPP